MDKNEYFNKMDLVKLRNINAEDEGRKAKVLCKIISMGELETYIKSCDISCFICDDYRTIKCNGERELSIPTCRKCNMKTKVDRNTVETEFIRTIVIQEPLDQVTDMQPVSYEAEVYGGIAKMIQFGMDAEIIGFFKSRKKAKDKIRN